MSEVLVKTEKLEVLADAKYVYKTYSRKVPFLEVVFPRKFSHPHLLGVEDFWLTPNRKGLTIKMKRMDGTLQDLLDRGVTVTHQDLLGVAEALAFLHSHNAFHDDIKPENIFYKRNSGGLKLYLADFGYSHFLDTGEWCVSTPCYCAPEKLVNRKFSDIFQFAWPGCYSGIDKFQADLWEFGVTYHHATTGKHPYFTSDKSLRLKASHDLGTTNFHQTFDRIQAQHQAWMRIRDLDTPSRHFIAPPGHRKSLPEVFSFQVPTISLYHPREPSKELRKYFEKRCSLTSEEVNQKLGKLGYPETVTLQPIVRPWISSEFEARLLSVATDISQDFDEKESFPKEYYLSVEIAFRLIKPGSYHAPTLYLDAALLEIKKGAFDRLDTYINEECFRVLKDGYMPI